MSSLGAGSSLVLCASPLASSNIQLEALALTDNHGSASAVADVYVERAGESESDSYPRSSQNGIMLAHQLNQKHSSRYMDAELGSNRDDRLSTQQDEFKVHDHSCHGSVHDDSVDEEEENYSNSRCQRDASMHASATEQPQQPLVNPQSEYWRVPNFHHLPVHTVQEMVVKESSISSDCAKGTMPDQGSHRQRSLGRGHLYAVGGSLDFAKKFNMHSPSMLKGGSANKRPVVSFSVDAGLTSNHRDSPKVDVAKLKRQLSGPLPWTKEMEERIEVLGPHLDASQKILLWLGIVLDIITKLSILRELNRYAQSNQWPWFSMLLVFFIFSSTCVTIYWWTHYPVFSKADGRFGLKDAAADAKVYGWSKSDVKRLIRNVGAVFAFCGLGTCFLAIRALFTSDKRQRAIAFDLRGMRLVDTIFLTLVLCLLQVYIGMMCTNPAVECKGHQGFDTILLLSILSSLSSASLCYTALDLNDLRIMYDAKHQIETTVFFFMRLLELGARTQLLAIFAVLLHGHIFVVFVGHLLLVVLLLRFSPGAHQRKVWQKVSSTTRIKCGCFSLNLPKADDMKLLVACLVWPPSCFVSDATAQSGEFWWRARVEAKRPFWNLTLSQSLLPWPLWITVMAGEATGMYYALKPLMHSHPWAQQHLDVAVVLHLLWLLAAAIWVATVHMVAAADSHDAVNRALARKLVVDGQDLSSFIQRNNSSSSVATLNQVIVESGSEEGSPKFAAKQNFLLPLNGAGPASLTAPSAPLHDAHVHDMDKAVAVALQ